MVLTQTTRAAVYLRISQDRTGLQAGIQRQQEDCAAHAAKLGFTDPQVFIDNDVSAFDGGRRNGYDALVAQVRAGVTHIIVWHVDRLYRQPASSKTSSTWSSSTRCGSRLSVVAGSI